MGTISIQQISSMNITYSHFSFDYFLESTARAGFKSFEFWAGYPHFCNYDSNISKVREIRNKIEKSGLKVTCLTGEQAAYAVNMAAQDPVLRQESIDYFRRLIHQAAELGIPKYLMSIGWGCYDEPLEESWKRGSDSGAQILKTAEEADVKILWEIMPNYTTNHINGLESAKRIVRDLDSDHSAVCVDTCAISVAKDETTLAPYLRDLGDKLAHIHLIDGSPDGWIAWGDGTQDLKQHLHDMAAYHYTGDITLEISPSYEDPENAYVRSLKQLNMYLPYSAEEV